jgi:uncharacterized YigZ family protein
MSDLYYTITDAAEGSYTELRSKFLAFAIHVDTIDEAKAIVKDYAKRFFDARHVCWAYMVGADRTQFLSSDNGEPSGTAGKPILGQINSFNLTNVVVIVVRYFGGIKLGTSGLIAAYREAAREALQAANIIECHEQTNITFTFPYLAMNDVMKTLKQPPIPGGTDLKILSQTFDNTCTIAISIRADHAQTLLTALTNISGLTLHDTDR